jgi:hypothetical protein
MLANKLTPNQRLQRAVALEGIATAAEDMVNKGSSPLETQTFVQGAERELAREMADTGRMVDSAKAAKKYKDTAKK